MVRWAYIWVVIRISEMGGLIHSWVYTPEFTIINISWKNKGYQKRFLVEYLKFAGIPLVDFILPLV